MLTVQMQITIVPEITSEHPEGYHPTLGEVNDLVQNALNQHTANLPPEDLAHMAKYEVHEHLTEKVR